MTENVSLRDRAALLQCRAGIADSHAHLALLDEVVSRAVPRLPYADDVRRARRRLKAALEDIDAARTLLGAGKSGAVQGGRGDAASP